MISSNKILTSSPLILDTDREESSSSSNRRVSFAPAAGGGSLATTTTTTPSNGVASATITTTSTIMKPKPKKKSKKEELSTMSHSSSVSNIDTMSVLTLLREASGVENRIRKNHRILERTSTFGSFSQMEFVWTFLTVLGIIGGIIGFYIDIVVEYIVIGRDTILAGMFDSTPGLQMFVWILFNLTFVVFALLLTLWVAPISEGSGIPPVKAILTGVDSLKEPLSFKTLIVKVLGVPCVVGAGMFVGKVGGMIHIGAALADNLMKLKPFRPLRNNKTLRVQLIGCGCALGVGAVFGAPAGGVLFALEAVGTYYSLRNYLKNFYVALLAAFVSRLLHSLHDQSILLVPVYHVKLDVPSFTVIDFVTLGLLGVVMGFLGVLFAFLNEKLLWLRNKVGRRFFLFLRRKHFKIDDPKSKFRYLKYPLTFVQTQFLWTVLICVITSILCFPTVIGKFMSLSPNSLIEDLMLNKPLLREYGAKGDWIPAQLSEYISETFHSNGMPPEYYTAVFSSLGLFILVRVIISPLSVSLPIPTCIYVTLLIMGAGFGRLWGELFAYALPDGWSMLFGNERSYSLIRPGAYAIVGGLALSASATQAFSTVLIFLEIAGMGIYWPAMLASMIAVKISRLLYYSAYDAQIKLRGWPALLETKTDSEDIKVRDIMVYVDELSIVEETVTFNELQSIFESTNTIPKTFPVVNSKKDLVLVGVVSVKQLQTLYQTLKDSVGKVQSEYEQTQAELKAKSPTTNLNTRKGIERHTVVTDVKSEQNNLLLDFDDFFIGDDWIAQGDKIEKDEEESDDDDDDFISNLISNPFSVLPGSINFNNILHGGSDQSTATATTNVSPAFTTPPVVVSHTNEIELEESINPVEEKEETIVDKKKNERIRLDYDTCQIAIADDTPAVIAHLLFSQLRLDDVFVLWMGRLIGQLHREVLIKKISDRKVLLEQKIV